MITGLHHISVIVSSDESVKFYEKLGFQTMSVQDRGYDKLCYLSGYGIMLEIYVDSTHPPRVDRPEAMGLRHLGLKVDDVKKTVEELNLNAEPIREVNGVKYTFIRDLDNQPIELHE